MIALPRIALDTPLGRLSLVEEAGALAAIEWRGQDAPDAPTPLLLEAKRQLEAYFAGRLKSFDLPLRPEGSAFERRVWQAMSEIPYGETRRYGDLAAALGATPRAVGQACGRNPLPVIVPCHRVLAAAGLGGYSGSGGAETKRLLLVLEGALLV